MRPAVAGAFGVLALVLVGYIWWLNYDRDRIQARFDTYKADVEQASRDALADAAKRKLDIEAQTRRAADQLQKLQEEYDATLQSMEAIVGDCLLPTDF